MLRLIKITLLMTAGALTAISLASAQTTLYFTGRNQIVGGINPGSGGGGCSNSLDFSQSCNSQYEVIIF